MLDTNNLQHIRIVAPDGGFSIVNDMNKDANLSKAVDYIGYVSCIVKVNKQCTN